MSTETAKDQAYGYIIGQLVSGDMKPGDRLRIPHIAKIIGRSTIPVREAISQLMAEGYLCQIAGNAVCVPETTEIDLQELYDLRIALERHAITHAIHRINGELLEKMRELHERMRQIANHEIDFDPAIWRKLDMAFHRQFYLASGNRRILKVLSDLHMMSYIFGMIRGAGASSKLHVLCDDHAAIIEAIENKDADAAQAAITSHIQHALEMAKENMMEQRMNAMAV